MDKEVQGLCKSILPTFSIVITVKNEERYIAALINSIDNLDYPKNNVETIIVDGGSTDNTIKIIEGFLWIKLIRSSSTIGRGRNIGIAKSTNQVIAITDGDCIVDRDWLKNMARYFKEDPMIAVIGGPYLPLEKKGLIAEYQYAWARTWFPQENGIVSQLHRLGTGNIAYRREALLQVGGFKEKLIIGEDIDLNLRLNNLRYKFFFATDVKIYHHFRTSFLEFTKLAFNRGLAARRYAGTSKTLSKKIRNLSITFSFPIILFLLVYTSWSRNQIIPIGLASGILYYYLRKYIYFQKAFSKTKETTSTITKMHKLLIPVIDIYNLILWSLGSLFGLFTNLKPKTLSE